MDYSHVLATYGYSSDATVTSFPEERRNWRLKIEDHITEKAEEINKNIDDKANRIDEHLSTVEENVNNINTYIVETIKPELDDIKQTVNDVNSYVTGRLTQYVDQVEGYTDSLEGSQDRQNTILQQILTKVNALNPW